MAMMLALLCAFFIHPAQAAEKLSIAEKTVKTISAFQKAKSMREWIDTAPGLSPYERAALRVDPRLGEELPKISVRTSGPSRVYVAVNGEEFDFSYLRQGKVLYRGKTIPVEKGMFLTDLAQAVALAMGPQKKKRSLSSLFLPEAAFAGSLMRGCRSKDLFTLPDIFESPLGYAPPIWISSALISVMRWGGDQLRDCKAHIEDLRRLLTENKLAIKSMSCGDDEWGSDREMEFWTTTKKDGEYQTEKYNLDYVNYFAEEMKDDDTSERLYVFGQAHLKEIRVVPKSKADFQEDCKVLNSNSQGKDAKEFAALRDKIEAYRKIFYYIGEYNSCTACREIETKIVSPRPPSYLFGKKKAAEPSPAAVKTKSSSAE
jgi:hypothetical protein